MTTSRDRPAPVVVRDAPPDGELARYAMVLPGLSQIRRAQQSAASRSAKAGDDTVVGSRRTVRA